MLKALNLLFSIISTTSNCSQNRIDLNIRQSKGVKINLLLPFKIFVNLKGVKINHLLPFKIFVNLEGVKINRLFSSKYWSNEKVSKSIFRLKIKKVKMLKSVFVL